MNVRNIALSVICFTFLGTISSSWATPAQVLIIRHGEKPDNGSHLSPQGQQRAEAYATYFKTNPDVLDYGTPVAIYAMKPNYDAGTSLRAVETMIPLAQALGLQINSSFVKDDTQAVAKEILSNPAYDGKMVLMCWEHKLIVDIATALGVNPAPQTWDGAVYDQVWEIDFTGDKVSKFREFSEHLMPWDH